MRYYLKRVLNVLINDFFFFFRSKDFENIISIISHHGAVKGWWCSSLVRGRGIKVTCSDISLPAVCPVTYERTAYSFRIGGMKNVTWAIVCRLSHGRALDTGRTRVRATERNRTLQFRVVKVGRSVPWKFPSEMSWGPRHRKYLAISMLCPT